MANLETRLFHLGASTSASAMRKGHLDQTNVHQAYAQRYYDHYTCNVIIKKLEKYGSGKEDYQEVFSVQLAKAYPYSFSTVPYSAGPSQAVKATVAFFYEYQQFVFKPSSPPRTS